MPAPWILMLLPLASFGNEKVLDDFRCADGAAAARAWKAAEDTPAVTVAEDSGRKVIALAAPFATHPDLPRVTLDRAVKLDLSAPGEFMLEIAAPDPQIGQVSLYFRSGAGWYSAGAGLKSRGWQTLRFTKAAFRTEGKPAGWRKIDGIRLSILRGTARDSVFRFGRLAAAWHDVALVVPNARTAGSELRSALNTAKTVADMLGEVGLGADSAEEDAVAQGVLQRRRLAILAHNPRPPDETVRALARFVHGVGKLLVCY